MANQLKMAEVQAITALLEQGWSQRRIARELGINRETVACYAQRWRELAAKPAILRPGSELGAEPKPANLHPSSDTANPATLGPGLEPVAEAQGDFGAGAPLVDATGKQ